MIESKQDMVLMAINKLAAGNDYTPTPYDNAVIGEMLERLAEDHA
jgi:hypothetical protein